jgi:hypothetical protein
MPTIALQITPGVDTEKTLAANETGVSSSSFIRWRNGMPEKRGGWKKYINYQMSGVINALHPWMDISGGTYLAAGSTAQLVSIHNGTSSDITPQVSTSSATTSVATPNEVFGTSLGAGTVTVYLSNDYTVYDSVIFNTHVSVDGIIIYGPYQITAATASAFTIQTTGAATAGGRKNGSVVSYAVTDGSSLVTATLNGHGYQPGDYYPAAVSTTVGGITIYGVYIIQSVQTNTFTFQASQSANANATASINNSKMLLTFYSTKNPPVTGVGYGVGPYGDGGYGVGTAPTGATGTSITNTDYWLDNWGEVLIAGVTGGPIFIWSPSSGVNNATLMPNAPTQNNGVLVAMPQQQVVAWGSTYNGISDPLQIRWSDAGDYSTWTPDVTNQAGGYHIPTGSKIQRVVLTAQQLLILTDVDAYNAQYVGAPGPIWGFQKVASGCGLIAPKALAQQSTTVYWMSQRNFFSNAGQNYQVLPCSVWDAVFQNLNFDYVDNIVCASNAMFNEIVWYYPSAASANGDNDSYVCYNTLQNVWDIGTMNRTAWTDQSNIGGPLGASNGYIYQHETSPDADGQPIMPSLTTGYAALQEGQDFLFVDLFYPDMKWETYAEHLDETGAQTGTYVENEGGVVGFTFNVTDYLGENPRKYGPYYVNRRVHTIPLRIRGRYVQMQVSSQDLGTFWRLGKCRFRVATDGRR